jgi:hypothetical protein
MIEIKNIKFKTYLMLNDRREYDYAIKYAFMFQKPVDIFKVGDFTNLEFGLIKDLQHDISSGLMWLKDETHSMGLIDYMMMLAKKKQNIFFNMKLIDIIQFRNYIVQSIANLSKVESIALSYEPSNEEVAAGIERLSIYGVYNQLLSVAGGDPLKIPQVRKMPYHEAFVFLCNQKDKHEYQERLMEISKKSE